MSDIDTLEEYKKHKQEKHREMLMKQEVPNRSKRRRERKWINV